MAQAGSYRHNVDIEQPTESRGNLSGGVTLAPWTPFATNWRCSITPESGAEPLLGSEFVSGRVQVLKGRYIPGLSTKMRINYKTDAQRAAGQDGRLMDIIEVLDFEERHREITIKALEAVRGKGI